MRVRVRVRVRVTSASASASAGGSAGLAALAASPKANCSSRTAIANADETAKTQRMCMPAMSATPSLLRTAMARAPKG